MSSEQELDGAVEPPDLRDTPRIIADEWSRRTWYGKLHVVLWEAAGIVLLLTLISMLKPIVYVFEAAEENWPSKYKGVEEDGPP